MSLKDGPVRSIIGDKGYVHHMTTWGERRPRAFIRFDGKLAHHPAWIVRPWVWQSEAQR